MRKTAYIILISLLSCLVCRAQEVETVESLGNVVTVDSLLVGRTLAEVMPAGVSINSSAAVSSALDRIIRDNETRFFNGYRIRVFQSSRQNAREASNAAMNRFNNLYPDMVVFRDYTSPFFRVMAGNFRTRNEAEAMLVKIKSDFPEASVVREKFKFPDL